MTKSELIDRLADVQQHLAHMDVELGVKSILEQMSASLSGGERIEIRGFGSFSLHYRAPRMGRNPKTGEAVALPGKHLGTPPSLYTIKEINPAHPDEVQMTGKAGDAYKLSACVFYVSFQEAGILCHPRPCRG